jgi:hypothetical protein
MLRKCIQTLFDFFVGGFDLGGLEGGLTDQLGKTGLIYDYRITPNDHMSTS